MYEKAQIWIHSKIESGGSRVLIMQLAPERGGFWQPITGKIEDGETVEAGAEREAFEETGFRPKSGLAPLGYDFEFVGKFGPAHETVFHMEVEAGCPKPLVTHEHCGFQWLSAEEAMTFLSFDSNRKGLSLLMEILKGPAAD